MLLSWACVSSEGEPGDLRVGPRRHHQERPHREDLPGLRRHGQPAAALGRHAGEPAPAGGSVAQPAVGRAGQLHPAPEEETAPPQQAEGERSAVAQMKPQRNAFITVLLELLNYITLYHSVH